MTPRTAHRCVQGNTGCMEQARHAALHHTTSQRSIQSNLLALTIKYHDIYVRAIAGQSGEAHTLKAFDRPFQCCTCWVMHSQCHHGAVLSLQVILMAGLQGVGKTTACGKLALALQKRNKRVLLVATDVYRPAAIDQLVTLGERIQVRRPRVARLGTPRPPIPASSAGLTLMSWLPSSPHMSQLVALCGNMQVRTPCHA
jgi:hypothetical protein